MMTSTRPVLATEALAPADHALAPSCPVRLAFLTNILAPYWKPVFSALAQRCQNLRILLSTPMERNRSWDRDWQGLDVVVQKTLSFNGRWRHPNGFAEPLYIHLPLDTVQQLRAFRADVVISNEMGFRTLLAIAYRKLHPRSRLIVFLEISIVTEQGRGRLRRLLRNFIQKRVDAFIILGEGGARYLQSFGVADRKIFRAPYTTDVARFSACPLARNPEHAHRLLYLGQLIERKGLLPFLKVLSNWAVNHPRDEITFTIAGEGPLRDALADAPRPTNLELTFLGNVSYADLPQVYADSSIFVFPTLADTWGVVVNEALASGLPVLGSVYSQAVEELIEDSVTGWRFRPDTADQIYAALDRCLQTPPEKLNTMREHARASACLWTPEAVASRIEKAIMAVTQS